MKSSSSHFFCLTIFELKYYTSARIHMINGCNFHQFSSSSQFLLLLQELFGKEVFLQPYFDFLIVLEKYILQESLL